MKSDLILFIMFVCLLLVSGCKDAKTGIVIPESVAKYPFAVSNEWEYKTVIKSEYYNKSGGFDSTIIEELGNTIVRVISSNQTLKSYNSLFRLESFEVKTPQWKSEHYYLNADSGLYGIAYSNAGVAQVVIPEKSSSHYLTLKDFRAKVVNKTGLFFENYYSPLADSVQFYEIPRKVLAYPISIGKKWVELIIPFFRERIVTGLVDISANNEINRCYEIVGEMMGSKFVMKDYFAPNSGLVRRDVIADSLFISAPDSPDPTGYAKSTFTSILVRNNF
ncbi:MAG: hypothetical protein M0Q21_12775 [Ignavibacteriaceae bacterium]|nr:hypothetical protein [Ignavibacteriaceae bacterium]